MLGSKAMFSVKELRELAKGLSAAEFMRQLGPFVLVQRPAKVDSMHDFDSGATQVVTLKAMSDGALGLLFAFNDLVVANLPPMKGQDELCVGRLPDCDLVLTHESVSKRHAVLRWSDAEKRCTVFDLSSTNGTYLNAEKQVTEETEVRDGDIVSFGQEQFWFLLSGTLHQKVAVQATHFPRGI